MAGYDTILCTTDFSEHALGGVKRAADLADRLGAGLTLIYVVEERLSALMLAASREPAEAILERHKQHAENALKAYVDEHLPGREVGTAVRIGVPHDEVVAHARECGADLIVVGTHGHGFVGHVLMGSTAERVLHHAPCPVLVVRPEA